MRYLVFILMAIVTVSTGKHNEYGEKLNPDGTISLECIPYSTFKKTTTCETCVCSYFGDSSLCQVDMNCYYWNGNESPVFHNTMKFNPAGDEEQVYIRSRLYDDGITRLVCKAFTSYDVDCNTCYCSSAGKAYCTKKTCNP